MIVLNQISLRRGVKLVLNQASVTLQPGEKVGLVGRNGAGKSSLFSLLTNRLLPISPGPLPDTGALPELQRNCNGGNAVVGAAPSTTCRESYTTSRIANGAAERASV